jgi:hypothetical protein
LPVFTGEFGISGVQLATAQRADVLYTGGALLSKGRLLWALSFLFDFARKL